MTKIIILTKNDWEFTDKATNQLKNGTSITYLNKNLNYIKQSANVELAKSLASFTLPALFEAEMDFNTKKMADGSVIQEAKVSELKFIKSVTLF